MKKKIKTHVIITVNNALTSQSSIVLIVHIVGKATGLRRWTDRGHMLNDLVVLDLGKEWSGRSQWATLLSHLWRHVQSALHTAKFSKANALPTMRSLIQQREHKFSNANTYSTTRTLV